MQPDEISSFLREAPDTNRRYAEFLDLILENLTSLEWAIQLRWSSPGEGP